MKWGVGERKSGVEGRLVWGGVGRLDRRRVHCTRCLVVPFQPERNLICPQIPHLSLRFRLFMLRTPLFQTGLTRFHPLINCLRTFVPFLFSMSLRRCQAFQSCRKQGVVSELLKAGCYFRAVDSRVLFQSCRKEGVIS